MITQFSPPTRNAILRAQNLAITEQNGLVTEPHLFFGILEDEEDEVISALLAVSGISRDEARLYAQSALEEPTDSATDSATDSPTGSATETANEPRLSADAKKMLELAAREAHRADTQFTEPHHLFIACVSHRRGPHLGEVLRPLGLDAARLRQHARGLRKKRDLRAPNLKLTARAEKAIEVAHAEMRASYCGRITVAHLLLGILSDESNMAVSSLKSANCDLEALKTKARASIRNDGEIATPQKRFSPGAKRALERAAREAKSAGNKYIGRGQILLGLLPQPETLGEKWRARGQELDSVDFLWTAAQAEALRSALGSVAVADAVGHPQQKPRRSFSHRLSVVTVIATLFWFSLLL